MGSLFLVLTLLFFAVIAWKLLSRKRALKGHEVSIAEAMAHWEEKKYFLDVRTQEEYNKVHIPGAKLIPMNQLARRAKEVPKDQDVYVICQSGNRSAEATVWLLKQGFDNVHNVTGGMLKWQGPVEK